MPCKHMFAVMENISGISWDSFCRQYKNSVYFKIDFEAIGIKEAVFTKKLKLAKEILKDQIITTENKKFAVPSGTSKDVKYNVFFGDEDSYPDCDCVEWRKESDAMQAYVCCNGKY